MGELVEFRSRRQLDEMIRNVRVNMAEQAAADIDRIIGFGCMHERVSLIGFAPMQSKMCRDCKRILRAIEGEG